MPELLARLGRMLLGAGCLFWAAQAAALSLGDMVVHSFPGEPLRASIPLMLEGDEQLAQVHVTLAPPEVYAQQNLERPPFLDGLRIGLLAKGEASARIQLFGEQPWQGEETVLLLQASWPQGELAQRFRLAGVGSDNGGEEQTPLFVEVAENETLDAIAIRLSEGRNRSYLHMMYALFLANPDAFYRGNMNNLKGGARLRVPSAEELYRLTDAEVFRAIRQQYAQWQQQRDRSSATTDAGAILSGLGDDETAALNLEGDPQALQQQMRQLAKENEAIRRRNEELKARLARLERQMQQVTEQVLDYAPEPEKPATGVARQTPARPVQDSGTGEKTGSSGLLATILFIVVVLVLGSGVLAWRYTTGRQGRTK